MDTLLIARIDDNPTAAFAVGEIARVLSEIDRTFKTEIVDCNSDMNEKGVLRVGLDPSFGVAEDELNDTIYIDVNSDGGVITGSNPRAVLIAAYRFLRELGCRFVRPSKSGEVIPKKRIDGFNVHVKETAAYPHRGVCIEGSDSYENILDMIDFLPKVGMNEYFIQFMVPTEFFARWYEHRSSTALKPEIIDGNIRSAVEKMTESLEKEIKKRSLRYHKVGHGWTCEPFGIDGGGWDIRTTPPTKEQRAILAKVDGKREFWGGVPLNTNLCYSNADVRDTITDAISEYAARNPSIDVIHFWLADGDNNHCECKNCRKERPSDLYVRMLNELDEKMTARGLKTKVVFLIYMDLLWEPDHERIQNPDRFILMFAPISRNYGQNYGDFLVYDKKLPPYVRNKLKMPSSLAENIEHLRRWQDVFVGDSFEFDYHLMWAHVGDVGYEKCAENLFCDVKDLKKIGLRGLISCQVQRCFFPTSLPFLSMAAALWDDDADFDASADDYYRALYGDNAEKVREAMKTLSASTTLYENTEPFLDSDGFARGKAMIDKIANDDPEAFELKKFSEYLGFLFDLFRALSDGSKDSARAAADAFYDWLWKNEPSLQAVLDAHNTHVVIERLIANKGL